MDDILAQLVAARKEFVVTMDEEQTAAEAKRMGSTALSRYKKALQRALDLTDRLFRFCLDIEGVTIGYRAPVSLLDLQVTGYSDYMGDVPEPLDVLPWWHTPRMLGRQTLILHRTSVVALVTGGMGYTRLGYNANGELVRVASRGPRPLVALAKRSGARLLNDTMQALVDADGNPKWPWVHETSSTEHGVNGLSISFPPAAPYGFREIEVLKKLSTSPTAAWKVINKSWNSIEVTTASLDRLLARGFVRSPSPDVFCLTMEGLVALEKL